MLFSNVVGMRQWLSQHEPKTPTRKDVVKTKKWDTKDETSNAQLPKNVDGAMTTIGMRWIWCPLKRWEGSLVTT